MRWFRRLECRLGISCGGVVKSDAVSVYWQCVACGKKDRTARSHDYWRFSPPSVPQVIPPRLIGASYV